MLRDTVFCWSLCKQTDVNYLSICTDELKEAFPLMEKATSQCGVLDCLYHAGNHSGLITLLIVYLKSHIQIAETLWKDV